MKKLLLLVTAFLGISGSAQAACTSPAVMHDFPGTAFNMSLASAPDGNCASNNAITTWGGVSLGAASNYGTSPGAVEVPGVNAFVTNTVAVTGTFWQATQPVSGTFWQTTQPVSVASGAAVDGWSVTDGSKTDVPCTLPASATACSEVAIAKAIANVANSPAQFAINVTPTDCSGTITAGGTAQVAIAAQTTLHGFTIANIDATTGSGEPLNISFTGTAAANTAGSFPLSAPTATTFAGLSSYTTPAGFGTNHAVSIIGGTTGHKYSCVWW